MKKKNKFYIIKYKEYNKRCSDCIKGDCSKFDTTSEFMKKLFYCIKCSCTSDKKGFLHR